jgi:myo-inositol-1-phosphate synthase
MAPGVVAAGRSSGPWGVDAFRTEHKHDPKLGVAIVGLGGAVATTAVAGLELLRLGLTTEAGLPLGAREGLVGYDEIVFGGWDVSADDLAAAAEGHGVLGGAALAAAAPALERVVPWPAIGDRDFCRGVDGAHRIAAPSKRDAVELIRADLRRFAEDVDRVVMVNLASTERPADLRSDALATLDGLEAALDADDPELGPAVLYAYAAIREGVPYANFTPSVAADAPALIELAEREQVPVAGKDGKTGQTLMKTVIAPGLRTRGLHVEGWFSTNILGNRDGQALDDPASLQSKLGTKGSVLDSILGYHVEDHVVRIEYYRPRGDAKEAWDTIDLVGFLGERMQIKVNFLCKDSILAAPLAIELARLLDRAAARGEGGVQEQLGAFFKAPTTADGSIPEHALHRQEEALEAWLDAAPAGRSARTGDAAARLVR